ncbi:retrovirus-related Pol polyprotein from transposon 297 [Trichonephila clavipes]|nr:retrovirus-related Pol polyprotein from transposon 297 [Trichonephila clavipes]
MSQWYAKFIKNYAHLCELLYNLKRKLKKFFCWSIEVQKAFDVVKDDHNESASFKVAGFQKAFQVIYGCKFNRCRSGSKSVAETSSVCLSHALWGGEELHCNREGVFSSGFWVLNKFRTYLGSLPIKVIMDHAALTRLKNGKILSSRMIRWVLKLAEFNIEWEHLTGTQNAVADVLSRNPVESIIEEKVNCALIRDVVLSSREQLIEEQKTNPELGHIYRYLVNPEE